MFATIAPAATMTQGVTKIWGLIPSGVTTILVIVGAAIMVWGLFNFIKEKLSGRAQWGPLIWKIVIGIILVIPEAILKGVAGIADVILKIFESIFKNAPGVIK